MSNWIKTKCPVTNINLDIMDAAFARMGVYADFSGKEIVNNYYYVEKCDAVLRDIETNADTFHYLKFVFDTDDENGLQMLILDTEYDMSGKYMEQFVLEYNTEMVIASAVAQGFVVEEEIDLKNGQRKITVTRAA